MKFNEITFNNIKFEVETYLKETYNKAGLLFTAASPYGQILSVIEELFQLSIKYLANAILSSDLSNSNSNNPRVILNSAINAGHNPGRSISSTGTLKFTLKTSSDISSDIPGSRITFKNRLNIKNITNNLDYSLNIGKESETHRITSNYSFFTPIIQGRWISKTYTGTGEPFFSFNVKELGRKDIENFNVEVLVNGQVWVNKVGLYDMMPDENSVIVRTGYDGGVDIIFGNGSFGSIPPIASIITVNYLISDGSYGNIFRRTMNDWRFIDDVLSGGGEVIDIEKYFNIEIFTDINFGCDKESIAFTKNILPVVSNNFVLGLPQQYAYHLKKLGVFSHVNAYENQGTLFIVATPNIKLFKNRNSDYFTIDKSAFELDRYEKSKIDKYLKSGGNIQLTKKYKIDSPVLSYYIINVFIIPYNDASDDSVNSQILDKLSEYFLNLWRIDRIPKLDIIRELSAITDLHSVDVQFISKKNEDYHKEQQLIVKNKTDKYDSSYSTDISYEKVNPGYNQNDVYGLDPILGDIIFEPNEIPIIRGGWYDRNGVYISDNIDGMGMKSVNIIKKGSINSKNKNK